jgi:hypothetical protein
MQVYVRMTVMQDDGLPVIGAEEGEMVVSIEDALVNVDRAQQQLDECVEHVAAKMRRQFRALNSSIAAQD